MDPNRIQSLVVFKEIIPEYCVGDDIECRFYVDPSLDYSADKIGLYRLGWTHKQDFIVIKEVRNCTTDEFDEKTLVFDGNQMTDDTIKTDADYLFCYFHPFGADKSYQLCGRSNTFRFYKSVISSPESERRGASPSAPELSFNSIHYPILSSDDPFQTTPKSLYNRLESEVRQSTPQMSRNSSQVRVRFNLPDDSVSTVSQSSRDQELDDFKSRLAAAERRIISLESELETKSQNESKWEDIHNELMDAIRVSEVKTASLEEHIAAKDRDIRLLEEKVFDLLVLVNVMSMVCHSQCQNQEIIIIELREQLSLSESRLELYEERSVETIEREEHRIREMSRENRQLKDKLQEVMDVSERLKQSNDRFIREKKSYQSINELLDLYRRRSEISVSFLANEMTDNMKEFCVNKAKQALEQLNDVKSIADFVVFAMDMEYGESWNCFIAQDMAHNSLLHVFGNYSSFVINGLKFVVYRTEMVLFLMKCVDNV